MKKFIKMMGIILTLAMLVSAVAMPGCVIADEETASIVLSSNTGNLVVPSGTNAKVTATVTGADNASKIEFYENDILVSTITDLDGELSCKVSAPEGRKYVYAKLFDAEGNKLSFALSVTALINQQQIETQAMIKRNDYRKVSDRATAVSMKQKN